MPIYRLDERFEAEQITYVLAASPAQARAAVRGEGSGTVLASSEAEQVGPSRIARAAAPIPHDDVPQWVREDAGDLFYGTVVGA